MLRAPRSSRPPRPLRLVGVAVSVLLLAAGLTACGDDEKAGAAKPVYVAMGDSFTAAPLMGPADGADGCFRSVNNYPHQLADALKMKLRDVSCSGATTEDVEGSQKTPRGAVLGPQINALDPGTDVVTVGLGANDFSLVGRIIITCLQLSIARPGNDGQCRDGDAKAGALASATVLPQLEERLKGIYAAIREKAPSARIFAVGYPRMFPAEKACESLPLTDADATWAHDIVEGVNEVMERAAEASGVTYIDTQTPSEGHDICGEEPWVAGTKPIPGRAAQAFHPYVEEQRMVTGLLKKAIGSRG